MGSVPTKAERGVDTKDESGGCVSSMGTAHMELMALEDIATSIPEAAHIGVGGVLLDRVPVAAVAAIAATGITHLTVSSFLASIDVEILVAAGATATVRTGYVGLDRYGGRTTVPGGGGRGHDHC